MGPYFCSNTRPGQEVCVYLSLLPVKLSAPLLMHHPPSWMRKTPAHETVSHLLMCCQCLGALDWECHSSLVISFLIWNIIILRNKTHGISILICVISERVRVGKEREKWRPRRNIEVRFWFPVFLTLGFGISILWPRKKNNYLGSGFQGCLE